MQNDQLIGLPVIHIDLGKRCGTVSGLILDPETRRVAGLVVNITRSRQRGLLAMEHVYALGSQAVTIADEAAIQSAAEDTALRALWQRRLNLIGMPVITVSGLGLGSVRSYRFKPDGAIHGLTVHPGGISFRRSCKDIPGHMLRSFGEDAVIVEAEATEVAGSEQGSTDSGVNTAETAKRDEARDERPSLARQLKDWIGRRYHTDAVPSRTQHSVSETDSDAERVRIQPD